MKWRINKLNRKEYNYVYEKPSNDKLKEITDVAKNIFGGTTSNTSNTSNIATKDLLNTIGAFLYNPTTNTTNSKAIESREKALADANTKKETTSTALKEAENAVKQALNDGDKEFQDNGVKVVVDKKSYLYLVGTTLDYSGGLNGKGFVFVNPNADRTCGCGESFSL